MKPIFMSGIVLSVVWLLIAFQVADGGSSRAGDSPKETRASSTRTPEDNKETVRKLYEEVLNTGKLDLMSHFVAEDYAGVAGGKGPAAFAGPIRELRQGFPDIRWTIEDSVAQGDRVAVRWLWRGTHAGSFREFAPTRKEVTNHGIGIFQFSGDHIVRSWIETDRLGFLQQIGAVPQDVGTAPPPQKIGARAHE